MVQTCRGSHLNMLGLTTATQPTNEIIVTMQWNYHCYRDTSFFVKHCTLETTIISRVEKLIVKGKDEDVVAAP